MTKFKKLMALVAVSMLGIQIVGVGTAFAANVDGECDLGSDSLEVVLGYNDKAKDEGDEDVSIYVDVDGMLVCQDKSGDSPYKAPASSIDSITVEMDDDDSNGSLYIYLDDQEKDASVTEWPEFETFDIDVTTRVYLDGTDVAGTGARYAQRVVVGAKTLSFNGTTATYAAASFDIATGAAGDTIDASKATVAIMAEGGNGNDLIKGGSKNDDLDGTNDEDVIYGNGGNDDIDCGDGDSGTEGWGGDGLDDISDCETAAPGAGDDSVAGATAVVYLDLKDGIEWTGGEGVPGDIETGGAAGSDTFTVEPALVGGSAGDDVIVDDSAAVVLGGAGDDFIKADVGLYSADEYANGGAGDDFIIGYDGGQTSSFFGGSGDDVLRGKDGDDSLRGGPGKDQAWGGSGNEDFCAAEVTNRCELGRV